MALDSEKAATMNELDATRDITGALRMAIDMLRAIQRGGTYSQYDWHSRLNALEDTMQNSPR